MRTLGEADALATLLDSDGPRARWVGLLAEGLLPRKGKPMAVRRTTRTITRNGVRIRITTVTQTVPVTRTVWVRRTP